VPGVAVSPNWDQFGVPGIDTPGTVERITTDATGLASTGGHVTLGSAIGAGAQTLTFFYEECGVGREMLQIGQVASFTATASPIAQIQSPQTSPLSGAVGTIITLLVKPIDRHGFYVPNAALLFTVTGADGAYADGSTQFSGATDSFGTARVGYVVGASATQTVSVSAPGVVGVTPLVFTIQRSP
jgi:hypothetical protein